MRPYFDKSASVWKVKVKDESGNWKAVRLSDRVDPPLHPGYMPEDVRERAANLNAVSCPILSAQKPEVMSTINLDRRLDQFYQRQSKNLAPRSVPLLTDIVDQFRQHCRTHGVKHLHEVRVPFVRDFAYGEINARNLKEYTFKARLSLLGKMFSEAIEDLEIPGPNPIRVVCKRLKPSDNDDAPPKVLTPEEIEALMTELKWRRERPNLTGPSSRLPQWVEDAVVVMLNTGIRVSAVVNMRFDWATEGKITIPKEWSKSGKSYATIQNDKVRVIIERRREELGPDQPRVFPEVNDARWLYERLKYIAKSLIRKGHWKEDKGHYNHILRHTFITTALNNGVPLVHVSKLAGHTSVAMTQRYDQSTFDQAIASAVNVSI